VSALLDTHSAIWYLHTPLKLSTPALEAIRKSISKHAPVFLSAISLVEIVYLTESGRLPLDAWRLLHEALSLRTLGC